MYKSEDKNVEAVRQKLLDRSQVGLIKYGVTTQRTDIDLVGWMNHAQEEAMDFAIYLEAAKQSHSDIATLEQECRQMRARMERLEQLSESQQKVLQLVHDTFGQCRDQYIFSKRMTLDKVAAAIAAVQP